MLMKIVYSVIGINYKT